MAKKQSESSAQDKPRAKNVKYIPDSEIDFSDIPEITPEETNRARRVGRPSTNNAKQLIALRISPKLLSNLRKIAAKKGKPYQTFMHELLEQAVKKSTA